MFCAGDRGLEFVSSMMMTTMTTMTTSTATVMIRSNVSGTAAATLAVTRRSCIGAGRCRCRGPAPSRRTLSSILATSINRFSLEMHHRKR